MVRPGKSRGRSQRGGHLYKHIERALLDRIEKGEWRPGDQMVSGREICAEFGVSNITVNRALQNLAHAGIIERKPGRGNFVKSVPTEQLVKRVPGRKLQKLALIATHHKGVNMFFDGFYSVVAQSVVSRAHESGCEVRMAYLPSRAQGQAPSIETWLGTGIEGVVFFGVSGVCEEAASVAMTNHLPAVFVDSYLEAWPCVTSDHTSAALRICRELQRRGHRRIGYLGHVGPGQNQTNEIERATIFDAVARDFGLEIGGRSLMNYAAAAHEGALLRQWADTAELTAIVTGVHSIFVLARDQLREDGRDRSNISMVAFDAWPLGARPDTPKLHGLVPDRQKMGEVAFEWLTDLVARGCGPRQEGNKRVIPMEWQEGTTLHRAP